MTLLTPKFIDTRIYPAKYGSERNTSVAITAFHCNLYFTRFSMHISLFKSNIRGNTLGTILTTHWPDFQIEQTLYVQHRIFGP